MSKHGDGSVLMWQFTSNVSDKSGWWVDDRHRVRWEKRYVICDKTWDTRVCGCIDVYCKVTLYYKKEMCWIYT